MRALRLGRVSLAPRRNLAPGRIEIDDQSTGWRRRLHDAAPGTSGHGIWPALGLSLGGNGYGFCGRCCALRGFPDPRARTVQLPDCMKPGRQMPFNRRSLERCGSRSSNRHVLDLSRNGRIDRFGRQEPLAGMNRQHVDASGHVAAYARKPSSPHHAGRGRKTRRPNTAHQPEHHPTPTGNLASH